MSPEDLQPVWRRLRDGEARPEDVVALADHVTHLEAEAAIAHAHLVAGVRNSHDHQHRQILAEDALAAATCRCAALTTALSVAYAALNRVGTTHSEMALDAVDAALQPAGAVTA